jgi:hypothetical protein
MCQFQVLASGQPDLDDLTASAAEFGLRAEMGRFGPAGAAPPPSEIWPLVGVDPSIVEAIER